MQRLGVPGKDGGPRPILGNWQREADGSVRVPMVLQQNWQEGGERLDTGLLPILDPEFNQLRSVAAYTSSRIQRPGIPPRQRTAAGFDL